MNACISSGSSQAQYYFQKYSEQSFHLGQVNFAQTFLQIFSMVYSLENTSVCQNVRTFFKMRNLVKSQFWVNLTCVNLLTGKERFQYIGTSESYHPTKCLYFNSTYSQTIIFLTSQLCVENLMQCAIFWAL